MQKIFCDKRSYLGKHTSKRLRYNGVIPGVIYGKNLGIKLITINYNFLINLFKGTNIFTQIIKLYIKNISEFVIIKSIKKHAYKSEIQHIVIQRIKENSIVNSMVQIHIIEQENLIKPGKFLSQQLKQVMVRCEAFNIPKYLNINISSIDKSNNIVFLSDLNIPKKILIPKLHVENKNLVIVKAYLSKTASKKE